MKSNRHQHKTMMRILNETNLAVAICVDQDIARFLQQRTTDISVVMTSKWAGRPITLLLNLRACTHQITMKHVGRVHVCHSLQYLCTVEVG